MAAVLTRDQVLALAPDSASAKAALGLLSDASWPTLGMHADAVWGECKGSGSKPYQTQVELGTLVSRCSCPSRKFPCKHGLALLLLYAQGHARVVDAAMPTWVSEWLASRRDKAVKKEQAAADKVPVDPEAAAAAAQKREAARWKRIAAGTTELQRWIADQFRRGLARFGQEQRQEWRAVAARMIDAQAPGLARPLEQALAAMKAGSERHEEVIAQFGLLQLVNEAVSRRAQLSPARLADLRAVLGWSPDREEVIALGDSIDDAWLVLGQITSSEDERLSERRVWLRGRDSGRDALLLDYAYQGKRWESAWFTGVTYQARLSFYPGSVPLRAQASEAVAGAKMPWPQGPAAKSIESASLRFAANPWLPCVPMLLSDAIPRWHQQRWQLQTQEHVFPLRLSEEAGWSLLAFSGGHPVHVMGEWDGQHLYALSARRNDDDAHDGLWEAIA
jgi:hypothetical protein